MLGSLKNVPKWYPASNPFSFIMLQLEWSFFYSLSIPRSALLHALCTIWPLSQNIVSQDLCMAGSFLSLNFHLNNHLKKVTITYSVTLSLVTSSPLSVDFCIITLFCFVFQRNYLYRKLHLLICSFVCFLYPTYWKLGFRRTGIFCFSPM